MDPIVTVLVPVYNAEPFLGEMLKSLFSQSYRHFELLIIDDGSTDNSLEMLESIRDSRLNLNANRSNKGLVYTLNRGLELANGRYVARLDADDIALPNRIERHLEFMRAHPEVSISGTWSRQFGDTQSPFELRFPADHEGIVAHMIFNNALQGGTAMIDMNEVANRELRFADEAMHAEDYDLFARAASQLRLANVPEVLILRRNHTKQVSEEFAHIQRRASDRVRFQLLDFFGISMSDVEREVHSRLSVHDWPQDQEFYRSCRIWLQRIIDEVETPSAALREAIRACCREKEKELPTETRQWWSTGQWTYELTGLTADGWLTPDTKVLVKNPKSGKRLKLVLEVPGWLPFDYPTKLTAIRAGHLEDTFEFAHSGTHEIYISLDERGAVSLHIDQWFVPVEIGVNLCDHRHLAYRLKAAES